MAACLRGRTGWRPCRRAPGIEAGAPRLPGLARLRVQMARLRARKLHDGHEVDRAFSAIERRVLGGRACHDAAGTATREAQAEGAWWTHLRSPRLARFDSSRELSAQHYSIFRRQGHLADRRPVVGGGILSAREP